MNTIKLYQHNVYLKETPAKITAILQVDGASHLALDKTVFFPEGGGQPCDLGSVTRARESTVYAIRAVYEKDGQVYHIIDDCPNCPSFEIGAELHCRLDWDRRFNHMQRHCGEHILSGIFFREYGGVNRGFHMSEETMTIDINFEGNPAYKEMIWEMAVHAERCANEVIWSNAPVTTRTFKHFDEASKLPLRKALALDEDITIVCVGDVNNPADCVACCGTHPSTAGQVGLIKIWKLEKYKGMTRIYFDAGRNALYDYESKHDIVTKLSNRYSANASSLLEKMAASDEKVKSVRDELFLLKKTVIEEKVQEIENDIKTITDKSQNLIIKEFYGLKTDDLLRIGRPFEKTCEQLLLIISPLDITLLLFSNNKKFNCGKLVKENASIYNGKGGGNESSARAIFSKREYLDTFIDLLDKHLR